MNTAPKAMNLRVSSTIGTTRPALRQVAISGKHPVSFVKRTVHARRPCDAVKCSQEPTLASKKQQGAEDAGRGEGGRRAFLSGSSLAFTGLVGGLLAASPAAHAEAALPAGGIPQGTPVSATEAALIELRLEKEAEARAKVEKRKLEDEATAKLQALNQLCATPYGVDIVGITEAIALIGALVGGISARARKAELEEVNSKLLAVNRVLRQQARVGVTYAPGLSYAPPGAPSAPSSSSAPTAAAPRTAEGGEGAPAAESTSEGPGGEEEGATCKLQEVRMALREGKKLLKEPGANASKALVMFNKALMLSRMQGDQVQERRATRGLAAAKRIQGDRQGAIADLKQVLALSQAMNEYTGDSDALGSIADILTEDGDLEEAGRYYDMYLTTLTTEEDPNESVSD